MIVDAWSASRRLLAGEQLGLGRREDRSNGLNFGVWSTLRGPTPEEVWNELLLDLKAASEELYAAFAPVSRGESQHVATEAETSRYAEALCRFDATRAKIRAIRANVRRSAPGR